MSDRDGSPRSPKGRESRQHSAAQSEKAAPDRRWSALRHRLYEILEEAAPNDRASLIVDRTIILVIVVNLVALVLESEPSLATQYRALFAGIEWFSLLFFTVEYGLRIWIAPEHLPYLRADARGARLAYLVSAPGIVDLLSVLPFWIILVAPVDLRFVLLLRVVRFFKLVRYSPAMRSLLDALYAERRALFGCFIILLGAALASASVMHVVEGAAQPDKFGTILQSMWWAIVTLGTIGYGDVVPVTAAGRLVATLTIFGGLVMIALPVGIVATAFANEVHRRDFVVTWGMVARVPLFSGLTAIEVADIMRLLSAQTIEPGGIIVRRGEPGRSMYFITAGEVEIDLPNERVRLGAGHFFGEIAVLRRTRRSATAVAVVRTSLLVLNRDDLHALLERDPRLAERIRSVARERLGRDVIGAAGDIVVEEIEEAEED
jgi:voltage-gated potassium channel